jgi:DNA-binding PadR family transcriptional regulator
VRRGDVRAAVLALLAEQPRNGYQLIREIARRSGGVWRPSPGSVYPALSQLTDEDLVTESGSARRREYRLTDAGRRYVDEHPEELAAPWANAAEAVSDEPTELWESLHAVQGAAIQVVQAGTPVAVEAARQVLDGARRDIYRILAGDADDD